MHKKNRFRIRLVLTLFIVTIISLSWCLFWLLSDIAVGIVYGYLLFPLLFLLLILTLASRKVREFGSLSLTSVQLILLITTTILLVLMAPATAYWYGFQLKHRIEQFIAATGAPTEDYYEFVDPFFSQFTYTTYRRASHTYDLHETPAEFTERFNKFLANSPEWTLNYEGRTERLDRWIDEGWASCGDGYNSVDIHYFARNWDTIPIDPEKKTGSGVYARVFARRVEIVAYYGVDSSCFSVVESIATD